MRLPFSKGLALLGAVGFGLMAGGCEPVAPNATQNGYRGLGMVQFQRAGEEAKLREANTLPEVIDPADKSGKKASALYQNVKVLGDLSEGEFTRTMLAMTAWVSPEQGCGYCHNTEKMADDGLYTKVVARRMLQMTHQINANWKAHVAETGVTCYTCHRGQPVPSNIWFTAPAGPKDDSMVGARNGQNEPLPQVGLTSLPNDPFTPLLEYSNEIRVASTNALVTGPQKSTTQGTEQTYALMIHLSQALGVNCTFCHNTRSFFEWDHSTLQRVTAWHGLRMVREINARYLVPLKGVFAANRLGPLGDAPKANCATCHQGVNKPLYGQSMLKDYPELNAAKAE
jgi:photosynthetic reaction center cytochrome c subunit